MVMFSPGALQGDPRLGQALTRVRARYALRVLFRGLAILAAGAILGIAAAAYGLDAFRYSSAAVLGIRAVLYAWLALLALRFVGLPLWRGRRQASDAAIARYIEEHEPSLDAALRSAVEGASPANAETAERSEALQARLVDDVITRLEAVDLPRQVDAAEIRHAAVVLAVASVVTVAFFVAAPGFIRQAFPYLFDFSRSGRAATPYSIAVKPGNHTMARGSDQEIAASLVGFDGDTELVTRAGQGSWSRSPMIREEAKDGVTHRAMLLSVQDPLEYFVESSGNRSEVFRLDVVDKPYVKNIDLEYRLPSYAHVEPQRVEGSGDISTLDGTNVIFSITPTIGVTGRLVVQGKETTPVPLVVDKGGLALRGEMKVVADGFYRVELQGADGAFTSASPDYLIEVVEDLPPHISFTRPGRDSQATPIEEVFAEMKAEDDFGVAKVELVFSKNGVEEKTLTLHGAPALKNVVAGHTFFLEEMSMKPGDFISYYARATDLGAPSRQTTTDIYFLEARPYRKDFRQAEEQGGGGGGGGGAADPGSLSQQQRQIIAATFRLVRDETQKSRDLKKAAQDAQTVALIQSRLRTQVDGLIARMSSRGALPEGSPLHGTADELRQATTKMTDAESELKVPRPKGALPPEQAALAHLQRAEAQFKDVQVSFGGGGGGGGGQSNSSAEELADLYELDLDKLRNQYETLQSGAQEQRDEQVDDALARLQELARRQEQENERARQMGGRTPNQSAGGGGGGGSQRQLADEAEELGRKLEKLTREKPSAAIEESARRLKEAAASMRQQAGTSRGQSGSSKSGESPLDRLRDARRLLDSDRSSRIDRDLSGFKEKAEAIKRAQETIAREMKETAAAGAGAEGGASSRADRLRERKDSLAADVADLESRLDKVARDSRREQKETSRQLQEAANGIRDSKLKEKIRYTKGLVDRAAEAEAYERDIAQNIDQLRDRIGEAGNAVGAAPEKKKAAALDRARSLAQALDSMGERLKSKGSAHAGSEGDQAGPAQAQGQGQGRGEGAPGEKGQGRGAGAGQSRNGAARDGEPSGSGRGGFGSAANGNRPGTGGGGTGRLSSEETRQLKREFAERGEDAQNFQKALQESGISSAQAAALAQRLQSLATDRNFKDPLGLAALTKQVAEDIKLIEYALRREAESDRPSLQLSGSEELPPGYRAMVEEYYRTLARKPRK